MKYRKEKKKRHLITFNIHKDWKSLNIISTEGVFFLYLD